ncbi:unnamed protein product [Schistosoma margrebowiei]|uniref:Dynein, axonemal, light intermediate chain 1 n=1 Tax=Schistosoma margrebowiei TaxID=48269 RepID=A0AA84ZBB1_9TREM|nr:unnamed protein product [Schistosoma margrebowiei]
MMPLNVSLIKYDNPLLITKNSDKKSPGASTLKGTHPVTDSSNKPCVSPRGKTSLVEAKSNQQTEEILNSILPPREWSENGQLWIQRASSTPATRLDVVNLQEELDRRLQQRQARETGICPVRRELYNQVFDELIRQVTINCAERGLLLLRVRDEIRMTIAAYQTLYESSIAFGMRKALQSEQGKADMERMCILVKTSLYRNSG